MSDAILTFGALLIATGIGMAFGARARVAFHRKEAGWWRGQAVAADKRAEDMRARLGAVIREMNERR